MCDEILPTGERRGGRRRRARSGIGLGGDSNNRASGPKVAVLEHLSPCVDEDPECRDRVTTLRRPRDPSLDDAGGPLHGVGGELLLAAGEVVVDRTARCAAVFDDVAKTRPAVAMLPEEQSGALDHPIPAVTGYDSHH